ncbi:hypothetical protein GIB67_008471 [Kingdonia uniflora]|uniref:Uncharacterized protein n=1 Tax=Kingdonia uniflora TaxID=39325 RepID=A0A7J7N5M4_9MAGN|nr:hypothetical protein GIB67_008471 [Kingdonia uniflora]
MVSTSGCARADEVDLVGHLSPVIGVGDEEDIVVELVEWPHLKGYRVEYPMGYSRFREFCKAKSSVDGIWGYAFGYRGNFFMTYSVRQGGDYLYLLPDLAKEKKCRHLGDEVSLEYVQGVVKESRTDGFCCYLSQFDYGLTPPLSNLAKSVMNMIGACPTQLNCNFWEVILVCETLNERWAASGSKSRITAKDFMEYYAVKYVTTTNGAYLSSSSSGPCFFDLSSAERVWNDNLYGCLVNVFSGISCKVSRMESFIDSVAKEGTELEVVLKRLGINRFKRVASKGDKVRRSQAKRRMAGKTLGSMEENMLTPELNTPLKLTRLNELPDGPVDMATVSNTIIRNLAKRNVVKKRAASRSARSDSVDDISKRRKVTLPAKSQVVLEESVKIAEGANLRPRFEVGTGLIAEQCRAKAREKGVTVVEDEIKKDRSIELERRISQLEAEEVRAESAAEAERLVSASATSQNNLAEKLYQLRYTKAEILAFSEGNYEEKEIVDEEEVEEIEDGLNVAEKTIADNQETIDQYEDRLDDNVKLSLKLEEAKSQVEDKTVTLLSRDFALNQVISKLAELKERTASGSRHDAKLVEYRIKALNDEISDMKCNIRALNEQLLDRLRADLRRLKEREAKSRADLAEVQAKKRSLVDNLAHVCGNMRRAVQRDKEMNERINQLCARITELKRELRAREMKYVKDLKLELDKWDGEIAYGEGSREMKEFLPQKEDLVENMRIDLTNSRHKSIDLSRQMSERIDQLTAELA